MSTIGNNKKCSRCQEWKCVAAFYKDARAADGLRAECISCTAASNAAYRRANKGKEKMRAAAYQAANKEKIALRKAAYRLANREKIAAYDEANKAKRAASKAAYYTRMRFALQKMRELGMQI